MPAIDTDQVVTKADMQAGLSTLENKILRWQSDLKDFLIKRQDDLMAKQDATTTHLIEKQDAKIDNLMARQDARTNSLMNKVLWVHGALLVAIISAIINGIIKTVF